MCPQFVDFNADGHRDILTATYDGSPHVAFGSPQGFAKPTHVLDASGQRVLLSQYWCYESEEWKKTGTPHCVSAAAFDWDQDGDFDLLLGGKDEGLFVQRNEGTNAKPKFSGKNEKVLAGGAHLMVPGGLTAPRLVDWNGDGVQDLVCGSFGGGAYLYLNEGEVGAPKFASARTLIDPRAAGDGLPSSGCYADPVDVDGDGDLDLLVGGYAMVTPESLELSEEEEKELEAAKARFEELNQEFNKLFEELQKEMGDLTQEEARAKQKEIMEGEEFQALQAELMACYEIMQKSSPGDGRKASVWLYERL